jgi:cytosine/adenosine deaminase-related metal-dependent hydrolase
VKSGAHVSSTPSTELQMALGDPVCFRSDFQSISSLGIDCHSVTSADIPGQMRMALQTARGIRNQNILNAGKTPRTIKFRVEQAFNLGTIQGARAVGMEAEIGSLAEGKFSDILIFDPLSPAMICAAIQDPVASIVLHSSVRDIDTVIVDGVIRKESRRLLPVQIDKDEDSTLLEWRDVAVELLKSRDNIEEKVKGIDYGKAKESIIQAFRIPENTMSD